MLIDTTRRYPRTLSEAFPRETNWADPEVVRAVVDTRGMRADQCGGTLQPEAGSAVSDFVDTYPTRPQDLEPPRRRPRPFTVSPWRRFLRALRRFILNRKGPL